MDRDQRSLRMGHAHSRQKQYYNGSVTFQEMLDVLFEHVNTLSSPIASYSLRGAPNIVQSV
jgi:hypothetical protein